MNIGLLISLLMGWLVGGLGNWPVDRLSHQITVQTSPQLLDHPADQAEPVGLTATPPAQLHFASILHYWTLPWASWRRTCPHCGAPRPWRVPLLELTMMAAFGYTWWRYAGDMNSVNGGDGQLWRVVLIWSYSALLLMISTIDIAHHRVPNNLVLPGIVLALLGNLLPNTPGLASALLGGIMGFGCFLLIYIVGRGSMGMGDVKLAGVIGLMTGHLAIWPALITGIFIGGVSAIFLLVSRRGGLKSYMPYGPYLALGALLALWQPWLLWWG